MHAVNILLFPIMLQQDQIDTIRHCSVYRLYKLYMRKKIETWHPNITHVLCTVEVLTLAFLCKNLDYKPQSICVQ